MGLLSKIGTEISSISAAGDSTKANVAKYGGGGLTGMAGKFMEDLKKARETPGGTFGPSVPNTSALNPDNTGGTVQTPQAAPTAPPSIADVAKAYASGNGSGTNQKVLDSIGKGWDDTGSEIKSTGKSLDTSKTYIGNISKVRKQMQKALDDYKMKEEAAIAGNKKLIDKNQNKDLTSLAGSTKNNIDNTNVMLGVYGATRGSAGKVAARILSGDAGKQRASLLTTYGDQQSEQEQAHQKALEDYTVKSQQANDWEKTMTQTAIDEYNQEKEALSRLNNKASGWKADDLKAANDNNLQKLIKGLSEIQSKASAFRQNLAATIQAYGGNVDALNSAAVDVTPPAELNTPDFKDTAIDINDPTASGDWYDPNAPVPAKAKVVKGYDALGNPIYEDRVADTTPTA